MNQALPMVYLVRHADTEWTLTAQHTGRTDLPLTEQGESQARALGASLGALYIDRILSCPLQHARRTPELAMPHAHVEADDELMEWDYDAYEGRRTVEIEVERPGWRLFRDRCPGGETLDSVGIRADRVIGRIRADGGSMLLFGHREVLRISRRALDRACVDRRTPPAARDRVLERPWVRPRLHRARHPRLERPRHGRCECPVTEQAASHTRP